jgi:hypothetical protein
VIGLDYRKQTVTEGGRKAVLNELEKAVQRIDESINYIRELINEDDQRLFLEFRRLGSHEPISMEALRDPDVSWFLALPREKQGAELKKMNPGKRAYLLHHCRISLALAFNVLLTANDILLEQRDGLLESTAVDYARTLFAQFMSPLK